MFDELLAEHLALQASRLVRSKKLSEAQETLEEALAAIARLSDMRMREADTATR